MIVGGLQLCPERGQEKFRSRCIELFCGVGDKARAD